MATVIVRNLPDEVHRALKSRAEKHGRSLEAEVRVVLESKVMDLDSMGIGSRLAYLGTKMRGLRFNSNQSLAPTP
jgi:plasmid stability protein